MRCLSAVRSFSSAERDVAVLPRARGLCQAAPGELLKLLGNSRVYQRRTRLGSGDARKTSGWRGGGPAPRIRLRKAGCKLIAENPRGGILVKHVPEGCQRAASGLGQMRRFSHRARSALAADLALALAAFSGDYTCTFTYSAQGGTNEQWQMNIGVSEDNLLFSCSVWRPQGKSYLFFTQFKAEVKGAKIEHAMAYSKAAVGGQSDVPLKQEEFEITETTVSHKEGKFRSELSKLMIVAKTPRDEL
nr:PREDICTED: UPF0556 protein C19orf10 homolog [Struthio camelus australis]